MNTAFLSGPHIAGDVEKNKETAIYYARKLRDQGYNVFCPHVAIAGYCDDLNDKNPVHRKKIMDMCFQWIDICDIFVLIPGFSGSPGAMKEYDYAVEKEKLIINLHYTYDNIII